ncbi:MAG: ABC transporter permease [Candidatus Brockarchaeota archaeon]|nr:ABC transporter permease [Candidatus Brockarchaeota archaeon]MBO3808256.1 ABC transporter permease [Candidatus Brockarchaeota archaeon]
MRIQRILAIVKKEAKKTVRDPAVLFMVFLFPVAFMLAFGAFFGGGGGEQPVYEVGVVNMDKGDAAQTLLTMLSKTGLLSPRVYDDNNTAQADLSQGKVKAVIIIPSDFSLSLASYRAAPGEPGRWSNTTIALYLDKGSLIAIQAVPPMLQQALAAVAGLESQAPLSPLRVEVASLVEVKTLSVFEFMAPGMFTFASIYILMMVAQAFIQDRENGMMKRIRTTPITPFEFMMGQVFSYMLIALVQAALVFATVYLLGFRPNVDLGTHLFAFTILLVFSLSNVGFGLIAATLAKSPGAATGFSFLFLLPQLFLGTFVGMSLSQTAQIACRFVPSYYVTDSLASLFLRGASILSPAILLDLAVASVFSVAVLIAGIFLYAKYFRI